MTEDEVVVFNDKSWVRLTEYQKLQEENEQLKAKIRAIKTCHFNGCIGCTHKKCEVKE